MELKDLVITPIFLIIIYLVAFSLRSIFTDPINKKYFIPALTFKLVGGLALGIIYQFYYGGGDTFTYFNLGSKYIWLAFHDNPMIALKLIFAGNEYSPDTFQYATKIYTYGDSASYFVVRAAGVFDILTNHTYSATALLFAAFSFSGVWVLYLTFYRMFPSLHKEFAIVSFFIPSLFFWGSGILKDTITIGALGWATFSFYKVLFVKDRIWLFGSILLLSFYTIYSIKIYILLCYVPGLILWYFSGHIARIRNIVVRVLVAPVFITIAVIAGYYSMQKIGEDNPRYNLDNIAFTAEETARWIHYVSERSGGSAYTLGDFDYSPGGMVRKFPLAVWTTLFRPYIWEAYSPVMLLSALESLFVLALTIMVVYKSGFLTSIKLVFSKPILLFCFTFAITFSFAVGISTYNFGSLVRYKIPMMPFYLGGLYILRYYAKSMRKRPSIDFTE